VSSGTLTFIIQERSTFDPASGSNTDKREVGDSPALLTGYFDVLRFWQFIQHLYHPDEKMYLKESENTPFLKRKEANASGKI